LSIEMIIRMRFDLYVCRREIVLVSLKSMFGIVKMSHCETGLSKRDDLKIFISSKESKWDERKENLGKKAWITLTEQKRALCLSCADLDHLVFLPSGDAAFIRRARKHSTLSVVVLKWSRARRQYER